MSASDLRGDCEGATHFIYGVSVGAFDFYAEADASVGGGAGVGGFGAGASSQATRETLKKNGDPDACAKSTPDDRSPPPQCGALIRIEVVPIGAAKALSPTCPDGTQWDGAQCVGRKVVTQVQCPSGTSWNGSQCVGSATAASAPAPAPPVAAAGTVTDATRAASRDLFQQGDELQRQGRFADALDKFTRAQAMFSAPTILLHIAECQDKLGMLVQARQTYRSIAAMTLPPGSPAVFSSAQVQAATELQDLERRMAQH